MYNNYYNTTIFNQSTDNPTLLPFGAYMEYEQQFKQTFMETTELKHRLDKIIFDSINVEPSLTDEEANLLSSVQVSLEPSPIQSDDETPNQPSIEPLPFSSPPPEPVDEVQTAIDKLRNIADTRDDIEEFIQYLSERYNIDLNEPVDDLPFEVIDEIMTYIDYDPDTDSEFNIDIFHSDSDPEDQIIIPAERLNEFQSLLSQFIEHVQRLKRLYDINGITDSRYDTMYQKFQQLYKPTVEPLIRLYHHTIKDYQSVVSDSLNYHQQHAIDDIDFDFEYDDYDY